MTMDIVSKPWPKRPMPSLRIKGGKREACRRPCFQFSSVYWRPKRDTTAVDEIEIARFQISHSHSFNFLRI